MGVGGGDEVIDWWLVMTGSVVHSELQNAPFRSQIFKIFFASGGKGGIDPLTKILRTPLSPSGVRGGAPAAQAVSCIIDARYGFSWHFLFKFRGRGWTRNPPPLNTALLKADIT